ncbi:metallophosphoesterase family protein [Desulfobotulus mexicanus]|uniref:Metallophosphoesterase n=1 Tax=Desulfobotulus mexicanus TaxID=2586642 RepID=A0A5S5MDC8_9BACT|nr:metallophosphoesterase family protein [Desulfobotulus mexicanus]TYT73717.1 metallophosphoesterase [Desulfobotulus mexicanus]
MHKKAFAVLSDIHGNYEALVQVLKDMESLGIVNAISLGDNIGYGPYPNEVVAALLAAEIPSVLGNHESAILKISEQNWFNPSAKQALMQTRKMLNSDTLTSIRKYPRFKTICNCRFVHGCPPSDIRTYLFQKDDEEIIKLFSLFNESVCFVGHTHELEIIRWDGEKISRSIPDETPFFLKEKERIIINCGSVGQPRDGDNRAKYIIYDPIEKSVLIQRVSYDVKKTVSAILRAGLPKVYADRLL